MDQKRCYGCMQPIGSESVCPHCGFDSRKTPNTPQQLPLGTVLRGQYLVGKALGQGGSGITYLGWDRYQNMAVAIREYYPAGMAMRKSLRDQSVILCPGADAASFRNGLDRFQKEARILAGLSHVPELARVYQSFQENNTAYTVVEYVQGITLKEYVKRRGGRLSFQEALAVIGPVVNALERVHKEGLLHRGIDPDCILMRRGGGVKLLDFSSLRNGSGGMGRGFAPIEQYQQNVALGPWTDVYSLCATLYYCVIGQSPPESTERAMGNATLGFGGASGLSSQQKQILNKGLSVRSAERYLSMEALRQALFQSPAPGSSTLPTDPGHTVAVVSPQKEKTQAASGSEGAVIEPTKRKPWAALLLVVLLAIGGAAIWYFNGSGDISLADRTGTAPSFVFDPPAITRGGPKETEATTEPTEPMPDRPAIKNPGENTVMTQTVSSPETGHTDPAFGTGIPREQIKTITVLYLLQDVPEDAVDISEQGNGKVLAWVAENGEMYDLYLAAEGGIYAPADSSNFFAYYTNVERIQFNGAFFTDNVQSARGMFYNDQRLVRMDVSGFNTANMTDMAFMFSGCSMLEKLETGGFDTAKVTDMRAMFQYCESLRTLNVSGFNTANVTDMSHMFSGVKYVSVLDVSNFDTANVTDMQCMFRQCGAVEVLEVSGFNTAKVTNLGALFSDCAEVNTLDLSGFDTAKVTSLSSMFSGCGSLEILVLPVGINTARVTDMSHMFNGCAMLKQLDVAGLDTQNVTTMEAMFNGCASVKVLDVSGFRTNKVMDMRDMFNGCQQVKELDVSGFNTAKVTSMNGMFRECQSVSTLAVDNFNTRQVTDMSYMFDGCGGLESLNISRFRTENVTQMQYMFNNCAGLTSLDISGLSTGKVTDMSYMFAGCSGLTYLKSGKFNTALVENMSFMFDGCSALNYLDLSKFNTSRVTNMERMFCECRAMKSLDLSKFDTSGVTNMAKMLYGCDGLETLTLGTFDTSSVTHWEDFMEAGKKVNGRDWQELFN